MAKLNWKAIGATFAALIAATSLRAVAETEDDQIINYTMPIHAFTSAGWAMDDQKSHPQNTSNPLGLNRGYSKGFYLENFDFMISPDLGNRMRFLAEIALEPSFTDQGIGIDTERLQFGYSFSPTSTLWIGRFHTPLGYYIIAYHHAHQLSTGLSKPRFLDFEDHYGVVPVHTTGLWYNGQIPMANGSRLGVMAWVGNGDRMQTDPGTGFTNLDMQMVHDENSDTTVGGRLTYFFGGLGGWQAGVTGMRQKINYGGGYDSVANQLTSPKVQAAFNSTLQVLGAHAVYDANGIEWMSEVFNFNNGNDFDNKTYSSTAGYSQLAYAVDGKNIPYIRYERGDFNQNDPYFVAQDNGLAYTKSAIGYRYNVSDEACVKIELSNTTLENPNNANSALIQSHGGASTAGNSFGVNYPGTFNEIRTQVAIRL
jgi:hypothetical protein